MRETSEPSDYPANDPAIMNALKEAWNHGYDSAVQSLRDMVSDYGDEQIKLAIGQLADALEGIKP